VGKGDRVLGGRGGCSGEFRGGGGGGGWRAGWYDDKTFALSFRGMRGARGWLDVQPKGVGDGAGGR